jgi:hypothetical protein
MWMILKAGAISMGMREAFRSDLLAAMANTLHGTVSGCFIESHSFS